MFIFKRKRSSLKLQEDSVDKRDSLNHSATNMAKDLIQGKGGEKYQKGTKSLFRAVPSLIQDVAPEYRKALEEKLRHTDA